MSVSTPIALQRMKLLDYTVREAKAHEFPTIHDFLNEHLYNQEAIYQNFLVNNNIDVTVKEQKQMDEDQRRIMSCILENFPALVVVEEESQKIVGVTVTLGSQNPAYKHNETFTNPPALDVRKSKVVAEYLRYLYEVIGSMNIYKKFPKAKNAFEFFLLAVDKDYRNRGLSTLLLTESVDYARKHGFDLVCGLFTSPFSRQAAEKAGLKSIRDWNLLEFHDSKGVQLTQLPEPYIISYSVISLNK